MGYYIVRCSFGKDGSMVGRPTATEAVEALDVAVRQGWSLVEITRRRTIISESTLRHEANLEKSFAPPPTPMHFADLA